MENGAIEDRIAAAVAATNGDRCDRLISIYNVINAIREAIRDEYGCFSGLTVEFGKLQSCVYAARRDDGGVAVAIGVNGAQKGHSVRPSILRNQIPKYNNRAAARKWANHAQRMVEPRGQIIVLTRTEARSLVAAHLRRARERKYKAPLAELRDVIVTVYDSLACNGPLVTSKLFDKESYTPAWLLIAKIQILHPLLTRIAERTVRHAAAARMLSR